jgi:tetratricopeptide (TPR) repeat protein
MGNLAISHALVGRMDEAIKLQEEVLPLSRKVLGPEHPATLGAADNLVNFYKDAGRGPEAVKLREEVLPLHLKTNPSDTYASMHLALIKLWRGLDEEHRALCLQPNPDLEMLKTAAASARQSVALAKAGDGNLPWFRIVTGLAAYREGNWSEAESILTAELKPAIHTNQRELGLAFRALARWRQGQTNEAWADLSEVEKLNQPKLEGEPLPPPELDGNRLAISLALKEARALLKETP